MKKLENIIAENLLRFGVKNLTEYDIKRLTLIEQETKEASLTKRINFPSGMHSAQKGNIAGVLGPQLKEMQDFLVANKGSVVEIILSSSESQVPNYDAETTPKTKLEIGQLSKMRYSTIETYMNQWLQGLQQQGIITQLPKIIATEPQRGSTPWTPPKGATPEQIKKLAADPKYTAEQWLEVTLKVVATNTTTNDQPQTEILNLFNQTNRTANAALSDFNASMFYNYSVAPAAVLNVNPQTLPGSTLTMNRVIQTRMEITNPKYKLPKITANIIPNGGTVVNLLILPSGINNPKTMITNNQPWTKWEARIANSYSIEIKGVVENSLEFENAWAFVYWYIKNTFPSDWNYISNVPKNIDFQKFDKLNLIPNKKADSSIENQQKWWSDKKIMPDNDGNPNMLTMKQWYVMQVKDPTNN